MLVMFRLIYRLPVYYNRNINKYFSIELTLKNDVKAKHFIEKNVNESYLPQCNNIFHKIHAEGVHHV